MKFINIFFQLAKDIIRQTTNNDEKSDNVILLKVIDGNNI